MSKGRGKYTIELTNTVNEMKRQPTARVGKAPPPPFTLLQARSDCSQKYPFQALRIPLIQRSPIDYT